MIVCSPLLYIDKQDHTWRFYVKDSGELVYSIMYEEDKWTKESKIDSEVLDFTVNIDIELKVYIIYSIKGGKLKYCIWENNQWFGKVLYGFEDPEYHISELNVNTIGKYMHIFFIAKNNNNKKQYSLMHFNWSNEDNRFSTIYNISFMHEAYSHYQTEVLKDGSLCLLLIHKQGNEVAIKFTQYKDEKWSIPRRLYGINGINVNFCTLLHNNRVSILNLSKESSKYSLEHVLIEPDGRMKSNKIYEGPMEIKNHILLEVQGVLWAMWSEGEKVFASYYKGKWSEPVLYGEKLNEAILTYKWLSLNNKYKDLRSKYILGTMPPEIKVLLPEDKNNEEINNSLDNSEKDIVSPIEYDEDKNLVVENELTMLKRTNKSLEKRILDLQFQLQQKQRIIGESDENFIKLTNARKKAEERLQIITEVQQTSIYELKENKKQKEVMENVIGELKNKVKELISENEKLGKVVEVTKSQKIALDKAIGELKNKLKDLTGENEELKIQLKYENNKGIMDRILKKKLDR